MSASQLGTAIFLLWFVLTTSFTFLLWLRPRLIFGARDLPEWYGLVAAVAASVFFVNCFALGVLLSIARLRGVVWMLSV